MKTRVFLVIISLLSFSYIALALLRAFQLGVYDGVTGVFWQVAIVLVAGISFGLILREIVFGVQLQKLARIMNEETLLLPDTLKKLPSGRTQYSDANTRFFEMKEELDQYPERWQSWFRLGLAYDEAGDRRRARESMRHAVALYKKQI